MRTGLVLALVLGFLWGGAACAESTATVVSDTDNTLSVGIYGAKEQVVKQILPPQNLPTSEIAPYFGPYPEQPRAWNDEASTILPFLLNDNTQWTIDRAKKIQCRKAKSNSRAFRDFPIENFDKLSRRQQDLAMRDQRRHVSKVTIIQVLNGVRCLNGYVFTTVGVVNVFGKSKNTTLDCFGQALLDTQKMGANVLVLLAVGATPGVASSTSGLGGTSGVGKLDSGDAYTGGWAIGYAGSHARPEAYPYIHGVAVWVDTETFREINISKDIAFPKKPNHEVSVSQERGYETIK